MNLQPLHDRILVRRVPKETITAGGIHIPARAGSRPDQGDVVAIGTGLLDVKVGDRVAFVKFAGEAVTIDGADHLIMREEDLLGVVEGA